MRMTVYALFIYWDYEIFLLKYVRLRSPLLYTLVTIGKPMTKDAGQCTVRGASYPYFGVFNFL